MSASEKRPRQPERDPSKPAREPIAIIGLGCRFPGNADSPEAFWRLIEQGRNAITEVPADRWNVDAFYDSDRGRSGKTYSRWGGFLDQIDLFDAGFFGISPREAESMDPQQRLLLEVAWEALEDAGETLDRLAGSTAGVFIGISTHDYGDIHMKDVLTGTSYTNSGSAQSIAANRISYAFDLRGPSMAIDTACSSSLVAVHLACRSIWDGESAMAFAGGVNCLITPEPTIGFSKANMLSVDGQCHTFDASANGYVRGEGAGVVLLKPLAQAMADGDTVYAVIRGTGVNQDGHTHGLTVPSQEMQEALLRDVYAQAGICADDVLFVEAHGTGTPVGDPIEANAIGNVLGTARETKEPLRLGSVKTNIGHLEAASGIAGLIKGALLIKHRTLPPNLNFETPNPRIDFERLGLKVQQGLEPWSASNAASVVGVNSFGFGGTNAHVVLDQAPESSAMPSLPSSGPRKTYLVPLSARGPEALQALAGAYLDQIAAPDGETYLPLPELAHAAGTRRTHLENRVAFAAGSHDQLVEQLEAFVAGETVAGITTGRTPSRAPQIAFVYSGMGPQWQGMGCQLLSEEPVFRAAVEEVDELFTRHAGWSLLKELTADAASSRMDQTAVAQPANFALQVGLTALWRSWGITPDAIVGHSAGEVAAQYASGVLSLQDAVLVIYHRSRLQQLTTGQGGMLAVGLSADDAMAALNGHQNRVSLAAVNSSRAVTLSGDADAIEDLAKTLEARRVFARVMDVNVPYHSHYMDPLRSELEEKLAGVSPRTATIPLYSTVTGALIDGATIDASSYWWRNVREPVQFSEAVSAMLAEGICDFVELSPQPVLARSVVETQNERGEKGVVLPSLRRDSGEVAMLLNTLGTLYTLALPIDWSQVNPCTERRVELQPYPWQRERYWNEPENSSRFRVDDLLHPLLERRLESAQPTWETRLNSHDLAYLSDHQVQGTVVYPAAAYLEMALAATQQQTGDDGPCTLTEIEFTRVLALPPNEVPWLQLVIDPEERSFSIYSRSRSSQQWASHAGGRQGLTKPVAPAPQDRLIEKLKARSLGEMAGPASYEALSQLGLGYGPQFQGIEHLWLGKKEALGRLALPGEVQAQLSAYKLHPAALDACFQVMIGAASFGQRGESHGTYVPVKIDRLSFYKPITGEGLWAHAKVTQRSASFLIGDITVVDDAGEVVAQVEGFRCQALPHAAGTAADLSSLYFQMGWYQRTLTHLAPMRQAEYLPSPASLAKTLEAKTDLWAELATASQSDPETALEGLTAAYALDALRELGWKPARGQKLELAGLARDLGASYDRLGLLRSTIDLLTALDMVEPVDGGWRVTKVAPVDPQRLERELVEEHPQHQGDVEWLNRCGTALAALLRADEDVSIDAETVPSLPGGAVYAPLVATAVRSALRELPSDKTLRVLELGAAEGATTALVLPLLPHKRVEYVLTARSGTSLAPVQHRFAGQAFLDFQTLDIEKDLDARTFAPHSFDLIITRHAMSEVSDDADRATANLASLLSSQGLLLALEPTPSSRLLTFVKAVQAAASPDSASPRPKTTQAWRALLSETFEDTTVTTSPGAQESRDVLLMARGRHIEQSATPAPKTAASGRWVVFSDRAGFSPALSDALSYPNNPAVVVTAGSKYRRLNDDRFEVRSGQTEDLNDLLNAVAADGPIAGVVYLWSLDVLAPDTAILKGFPAASDMAGADVLHLVHGMARLPGAPPRLYVVTSGAQNVDSDDLPGVLQSPLWGLGRVIMNEHPHLRCTLVDLPADTLSCADALLRELRADDGEQEICLRPNGRFIPKITRLEMTPAETPDAVRTARRSDEPFTLEVATSGSLDSLVLRERRRKKPGAGEVEIEVYAAGLNFRDVMKAMGLYPSEEGDAFWLGDEFSGVIAKVGNGVKGLKVGDEVLGVAPGCFSSYVTVPASTVVKKPSHLSFEEAAALPIVFLTTHYALNHVAGLSSKDRLLIHAAAGGVGLAAVQMAQRVGAEIFATAGSTEKRNLLRDLGVKHLMDSRSLTFAEETMRLTHGEGVDVVLNSLAGEFIPASMSLLRPMGRFLELGKVDLYQNSSLGLWPFRSGLSFSAIDMGWLIQHRPELARTLLVELMAMFEAKELRPLPVKVFPISEATQAFRFMAQARHVGKIVMSMREGKAVTVPAAPVKKQLFRKDGTYLVSGGLGGFGLAIAQWLVDQGARHLVLAGRSGAATPEAEDAIAQLRASRVEVEVAKLDVTDRKKVEALVSRIGSSMPPLRGVFHAAMVLDDAYLLQLTKERFETAMKPKAEGAWNLHVTTLKQPLDHFVLFSSLASWAGSVGQANYAAANAFLDSLAQYRQGQQLPALSVNWGVISDVGYVSRNADIGRQLSRQGFLGLKPAEATEMLGALMQTGLAEAGAIRVDFDSLRDSLGRGPAYRRFANVLQATTNATAQAATGARGGGILESLRTKSPEEQLKQLEALLRREVAKVLGVQENKLDPDKELSSLGLDSLMSVELEMTLERELGADLPLGFFLGDDISLRGLCLRLRDQIHVLVDDDGEGAGPVEDEADADEDLADLLVTGVD